MTEKNNEGSDIVRVGVLSKIGLFNKNHEVSPMIVLVGLLIVGLYPLFIQPGSTSLTEYAPYFVWIILAESWNLSGGYAGLLNLGLVAFFALGAFVTGFEELVGLGLIPALLIAGIIGAVLAIILIPTLRLRSDYFAIGSLVIPFMLKPIVEVVFPRTSFFVPGNDILTSASLYYLGLLVAGISIFGIYLIMRSRIGMALRAIGNEEAAAQASGINTLKYKAIALILSAFLASIAGGYFLQHISVDSSIFSDFSYSLFPIFMVIIGGIGTFEGPIVGAVLFSVISYALNNAFPNTTYDVLLFSVIIMVVAVLVPRGIVPSVKKILTRKS
jgi:branched-chain amino acid transport system permease protein